jgi:anti-sigma B factor antagonist
LRETADGDRRVLILSGELDLAAVAELQDAVSRACADRLERLEIDLDSVEFIDSSGIASLLGAHQSCVSHGVELSIVPSAHPGPRRLIEISGLQGALPWRSRRARARAKALQEDGEALRAQSKQLIRKASEFGPGLHATSGDAPNDAQPD